MEKIKQVGIGEEFTSTRRLILKYRDKTMESHCRRWGRAAGWINLSYFSPQSWFRLIFSFVTLKRSLCGDLGTSMQGESTGGTLKMMAVHKGLSKGQACMCTTSPVMATVRDSHYHLLCFWTKPRGSVCSVSAHAECLLCLSHFHMVLFWHAGWVNVNICGGGRLKGAPNCQEMTLTAKFHLHHLTSWA